MKSLSVLSIKAALLQQRTMFAPLIFLKIGINFNGLKNQIGLFSNPKSVIINPIFLKTLSRNQLQSGFAEVIKHSLITNKKHWEVLSNTLFEDLDLQNIIDISIQIKNTIVKADPLEKNNRKKLNFGHTYGHAIESYYLEEKKPILHGESVLMGIILECELSLLSQNEKIEIKNYLIKKFQLPDIPSKNKLMKFLINDKKNKEAIKLAQDVLTLADLTRITYLDISLSD
mgnify:CR=1 FL=1